MSRYLDLDSETGLGFVYLKLNNKTGGMAEEKTHEFYMAMTCEGCAAAAKKVMGKLPEVSKVETDVEKKLVWVTSILPPEQLEEQLKKTGKEIKYNGTK